ncbi:12466_t:CDS:10 [Ambispora gerdemannii]|uniref:12466_t:CDS:1 n=1 Tax=Ambispora gerdemannii TaxID=144530 RepID=A0A9N8Z0S9_9GLOM|nr:12466_t:CDS:10 [Ambispora gerdemannii]
MSTTTLPSQANPLDPANVLNILENVLPSPRAEEASTAASASENVILRSGHDALAALFHSIMLAVDFRFVGLGEEGTIEIQETQNTSIMPFPKEWNAKGPDSYAFRYKHTQSSLTFLVKGMRLSNKFLLHGMGVEDNKTFTMEVLTDDYTSPSFFPYTAQSSEPLINGFISQSRLNDLITLYKINVIQNLIPNLNKPGYEESTPTRTSTFARAEPRTPNQQPEVDPLRIPPRPTVPFHQPDYGMPYGRFDNPFSVGRDDLDPLGSNPIIGPPRFGGYGPPPLGGFGPSRGGGMFVGPDHPMFDPRRFGGGREPPGGPQTLPRGAVPPGARFDPIGPFGRGYFSGEPDPDDEPPPGYSNMFM